MRETTVVINGYIRIPVELLTSEERRIARRGGTISGDRVAAITGRMSKRGLLRPTWTGTRGLTEALDDLALFKRRYIDNLEADIESLLDRGVDASGVTLANSFHTITQELRAAKKMTDQQWREYIDVFRHSPLALLPHVSDWKAGSAKSSYYRVASKSKKRLSRSSATGIGGVR